MVAVIIKIRSSHVPGYHCGKGDWTAYGAFSFLFLNPSHSKEWRMKEVMCVCVCVCVCARAHARVLWGEGTKGISQLYQPPSVYARWQSRHFLATSPKAKLCVSEPQEVS